jgi:hypothetical protein
VAPHEHEYTKTGPTLEDLALQSTPAVTTGHPGPLSGALYTEPATQMYETMWPIVWKSKEHAWMLSTFPASPHSLHRRSVEYKWHTGAYADSDD